MKKCNILFSVFIIATIAAHSLAVPAYAAAEEKYGKSVFTVSQSGKFKEISEETQDESYGGENEKTDGEKKKFIRYIDFTPSAQAMSDCAAADIGTYGSEVHFGFVSLLAYLSQKYGGNFEKYKKADLTEVMMKNPDGNIASSVSNEKLYNYYLEAYSAILGGFISEYREETAQGLGEKKYGICVYSPICAGRSYSHYDDFGASRSYGYKRHHLGHDIMGSAGTPIVAVESGYVEALGWNMYGGWRIGIRSFDGKRYYYYAHLRKDHPYADIEEGDTVMAGQIIGYLGMTGYSRKENVNNINVPHLHVGMEIIFDPSQKDGYNQIWVDMYEITDFLSKYRSVCSYDGLKKESVAQKKKIASYVPD